jgi:hypothetical protein
MHRTFESSSSSKTPHPSSSLHDDGEDDFERLLRLSLVSREDDEEVLNEEGKGARRRAGAQRRISRDDDDVATPRVELFSRHQNVASTNALDKRLSNATLCIVKCTSFSRGDVRVSDLSRGNVSCGFARFSMRFTRHPLSSK